MNPDRDVARRGQVFTPAVIVDRMLALVRNRGRVLEPACGDGAFSARIPPHHPEVVAIELDPAHCPPGALNADFFTYPEAEQFETIIGNPPYVKARDILPGTRRHFSSQLLDGHANLYLHFFEKCIRHLRPGGELIFIVPREFTKLTAARRLNAFLFEEGDITDFIELGDARVFGEHTPNCAIFRFERGRRERHPVVAAQHQGGAFSGVVRHGLLVVFPAVHEHRNRAHRARGLGGGAVCGERLPSCLPAPGAAPACI
jgi:adenine-specific DNA-methyltransferase